MNQRTPRLVTVFAVALFAAACSSGMSPEEINDHASRYTDAWNSGDPASVALFYSEDGSLKVNDAEPAVGREAITEVARSFMTDFPDMEIQMRELEITDAYVRYHWRFLGTNTGPGGTGAPVDFNGFEEWTFGDDNLISQSLGNFDNNEFQAQLNAPRPLTPDSSNEDIVAHMLQHEKNQTMTDALSINFPELDRERAYAIQQLRLEQSVAAGDQHVGWKLGWTRLADPSRPLDPAVGHYTRSRVFRQGEPVPTSGFTDGIGRAEPEIVFYLDKDLPGPTVTREQVIDAIREVGISLEIVNWRAMEPRTVEHGVVDNVLVSGAVLADRRHSLSDLDFTQIEGTVTVNSAETATGRATVLMGKDPLEALIWAANELPKYGMHLEAGQFVLSGTVSTTLPVSAGDRASVAFTGMGSLNVEFVE